MLCSELGVGVFMRCSWRKELSEVQGESELFALPADVGCMEVGEVGECTSEGSGHVVRVQQNQ